MNHTPQIKRAIQFAARKHHGQMRKETEPLPYITHLFSAAILVAEDGGAPEEAVIAALLHDTIEDTETTREEIVERFGERVAAIVETVTEPKGEGERIFDWKERKERYLAQLEKGSDDALLVSAADKIDNIESKLDAYDTEGKQLLNRWARPLSDYLWYHGSVLEICKRRIPNHTLVKRLTEAHAREQKVFS